MDDKTREMADRSARRQAASPPCSLQLAVLIVMPIEGWRKARTCLSNPAGELGEVQIGTTTVPCGFRSPRMVKSVTRSTDAGACGFRSEILT